MVRGSCRTPARRASRAARRRGWFARRSHLVAQDRSRGCLARRSDFADHEVLLGPEPDLRERRCLDVVGLCPVDEDAAAAADDVVAGDADHALLQTLGRIRVGREVSAELTAGVKDDDLPTMRVAQAVGEAFGERSSVTGRDRRSHAGTAPAHHEQKLREDEHRQQDHDRDHRHDRNQHALAAQIPSEPHLIAVLRVVLKMLIHHPRRALCVRHL
jgi:hypothetical protein